MTALLFTLIAATSCRISVRAFSPIQEFMAKTPEMARESARPVAFTPQVSQEVLSCFLSDETRAGKDPLQSIRLAFFDGKSWLYVDHHGVAEYGGRRGVFHVKRWLALAPRLFPSRAPEFFGSTKEVGITSEIDLPVTVVDRTGEKVATVAARSSKRVQCWWGPHELQIEGFTVAKMDRFWSLEELSEGSIPKEFQRPQIRVSSVWIKPTSLVWIFDVAGSPETSWAWEQPLSTTELTPRSNLSTQLMRWRSL